MPRSAVRVVFTGHTGINKTAAIQRLRDHILNHDPEWSEATGDARSRREAELVGIYSVEDGPPKLATSGFYDLDTHDWERQITWEAAFEAALNRWRQSEPKPVYSFLCLHLSFQIHSHLLTPLAWWKSSPTDGGLLTSSIVAALKEFSPHHFVTLIDNVHQIQNEIAQRTVGSERYYFRLIELLRWREVETMMTDILARDVIQREVFSENVEMYPFEHSPQIAVRHTCRMLHSFVAEPEKPRLYISYPISKPRRIAKANGSEDAIREINDFRERFDEEFTVFDPVTIDERILKFLSADGSALGESEPVGDRRRGEITEKMLTLRSAMWWPIRHADTISGIAASEIKLVASEVEEITKEIKQNVSEIDLLIRYRDYRLIDQADYVVIYRPTYPEGSEREWSTGTWMEYLHARRCFQKSGGIRKRVHIIRDSTNDGPLDSPPFQLVAAHRHEGTDLHIKANRDAIFSQVVAAITADKAELQTANYRPRNN